MLIKENTKLSVIVPCYNEVSTIDKIIPKVIESIEKIGVSSYQIVIVDDNSFDRTIEKLKILEQNEKIEVLYNQKNLGKGGALQKGLKIANGDLMIIQDADLEYDPSDYSKLLLPFFETSADVVYGSRFLGGGKYIRIHFFWHYLANKILTFICNAFINLNLTDMETGYKVFRSEVIRSINIEEKSFAVEPEITIKLAKKKFKFFEVAISYNGRSYSEGKKIGLKDAFIALKAILKYSFYK